MGVALSPNLGCMLSSSIRYEHEPISEIRDYDKTKENKTSSLNNRSISQATKVLETKGQKSPLELFTNLPILLSPPLPSVNVILKAIHACVKINLC